MHKNGSSVWAHSSVYILLILLILLILSGLYSLLHPEGVRRQAIIR